MGLSQRIGIHCRHLYATAALVLALMLVWTASAMAEAPPSWKIVSLAEPTNLTPPRSEIIELTVKATQGDALLYSSSYFLEVQPSTTAAELQATLEGEVGAGNVQVRGGPGDATGSKPYVITFTGSPAAEQIGMKVYPEYPNSGETATVKIVQRGGNGGEVVLTAVNVGGATNGSTVTITDTLPPQLTGLSVQGYERYGVAFEAGGLPISCEEEAPTFRCTYSGVMETGDALTLRIPVRFGAEVPSSVANDGSVAGGGAEQGASVTASLPVSETPAGFGVTPGSVVMGVSSLQAGAHPDVTSSFRLNTQSRGTVSGNAKDVHVDLPPGLVGNTVGLPKCPAAKALVGDCPRDTIVGVAATEIYFVSAPNKAPTYTVVSPVYDIEPSPGEPAAFVFTALFLPVRLDTSVLSDGNDAVRVTVANISEAAPVFGSSVTIWGVPADHEGPGPIKTRNEEQGEGGLTGGLGGPLESASRVPLLTNPTQCSEPLTGSTEADEWGARGVFSGESVAMGTLGECDLLPFSASMSMLPDTLEAGAPAGYDFKLHVPQVNSAERLAQPDVKKVVVALPQGTVVSPSAAVGLASCSDEQFYGPAGERGLQQPAKPGHCPRESQVGTVEVRTPALALPLTGEVYLGTPECEPCSPEDAQGGKMVRLLVQLVGEGQSGIVVKFEGRVSLNQQTGQLTATFENNPPLPFSDLNLKLGGGSRATLANPRTCGPVSTGLDMTPWSTPFTSDLLTTSPLEINQDCFTPRFTPSFVAGTTNLQAGAFTPFTLSFGRSDQDEFLNGLEMHMPPGLLGSLSGIPLCKEPQAAVGACSEESLLGHVQVLTGPGATPFLVTGGKVFLTEGYKGAPFGLSIVVPAKAGPFTLTGTTGTGSVVVRAKIAVDPTTAALTVTSDPLPTMLDGIPLQLKVVNVTIDRPGFTFNPTSCNKLPFTGTLDSAEGATASVSVPFQVTNCETLAFKPDFSVSTEAKTSRIEGAALHVHLTLPNADGAGTEANVAKVKVSLPKALPTPLPTLQRACTEKVFAENPASCPEASRVGVVRVSTPVLEGELTGPAYFVSHGGAKYPELIMVLTGEDGVTVQVHGETFISKQGVTTATFGTVPDVPFSTFELTLPKRKYPALSANGNLCKVQTAGKLVMPTEITGQNGKAVKRSTKIAVSGCPTVKKKAHKRKQRHAKKKKR